MIEIHLLTNQVLAVEHEDAGCLHLHRFATRSDSGPWALMRTAKFALQSDRLIGVIESKLWSQKSGKAPSNWPSKPSTASAPSTIAPKAGTSYRGCRKVASVAAMSWVDASA